MTYCTLVRPKLEYASFRWNSVNYSDACKLERIQLKFVYLRRHRFFSRRDYSCGNVLSYLNYTTLSARKRYLMPPFLTDVLNGSEYCPTLLENVGLRVSYRNFRHISLFNL